MANLKFKKVSWTSYEKDCFRLSRQLTGCKIDTIIAISRGGLVVARILSDLLSLPVSHITIASYNDLRQKKQIIIKEFPSRSFQGETILIVDEICDTGRTFKRALSYFKNFHIKTIYTLTLYLKPKSSFTPDFYARKTDSWVMFPYEPRETYQAFKKMYRSKEKAINELLQLGYKKWEVDGF